VSSRVLVTYAASTGCDSNCAVDIAAEIAAVPDLDVDVQPMASVPSLEPYSSAYVGWVHPSSAGERELGRFLTSNAELLPSRPIWIVHLHPGCSHDSGRGPVKMTRLIATPKQQPVAGAVG
jgi:menaquinone-dependent protoporphyrinogen IX oxidase